MADRYIASCSSNPEILTHTETLGEVVQTENESDIEDATDFQEEDLTADNTDDLEK